MGKKFSLIQWCIIASSFSAIAQPDADSLRLLLNKTSNDTVYVVILNELSSLHSEINPLIALEYAVKAEKIAENCNYREGLALAYSNIANLYTKKENYELAIENHLHSVKYYQILNNKTEIATTYGKIGKLFQTLNKYEKAYDFHNYSLEISKEINDSLAIAKANENIGLIYSEQGKYDKALIHFYNSLRLKEAFNDKSGIADSYNNIGSIYFMIESYDQAQVNFERSLILYQQLVNETGQAISLLHLGEIYIQQQAYAKALDALKLCLEINIKRDYKPGIAEAYLKLGRINFTLKKFYAAYENFLNSLTYYEQLNDSKGIILSSIEIAKYCISYDDFENGKKQLLKSLNTAQTENYLSEEYQILKLLAEIYIKQENFSKASLTYSRANQLSDSLAIKNATKKVAQILMQFEFEKKIQQKEMEKLKEQFQNQLYQQKIKTLKYIAIVALIIIIAVGLILLKLSTASKRKNKTISELKKTIESQISELKNQKLDLAKANFTKNKYISIIGHDLRNPFNAINSFISKITDNPEILNNETLLKHLVLIKEAGVAGLNLLENLIEWAKLQSGEFQVQLENVPINYILRGNMLYIKEIARYKNIELIEDLSGNPTIQMDKNLINSVIRNMLSNALKFTNYGGTIWIKTIINNNEVKIVVQDTGVGISEEILGNLFEINVLKQHKDGSNSSGLGLILCKELLHLHRQELRVDSKINFGTTFWFYLPIIE
jgi:signal transduction histidine kinase